MVLYVTEQKGWRRRRRRREKDAAGRRMGKPKPHTIMVGKGRSVLTSTTFL